MYEVYLITNNLNKMRYVGITSKTSKERFWHHCSQGYYLTSSIKKHGKENFTLEVLVKTTSKKLAVKYEKILIEKLKTKAPHGYNFTDGGEAPALTPEIRAKISKTKTGKKVSPKHLEGIRKAARINGDKRKGIKRPEFSTEWKVNISKGSKGKVLSNKHRDAISEGLRASEKFKNRRIGDHFKLNNPSLNPKLKEVIARKKWKPVYCCELDMCFLSVKAASEHLNFKGNQLGVALWRGTKVNGHKFYYIYK